MAKVSSIHIGSYIYKNCVFERKDESLFKLALYTHSEQDLVNFLEPLIVRITLPKDKIISLIRTEVEALMQEDSAYIGILDDMLQKEFNLKLLTERLTKRIGYSYRSIGQAVKLMVIVYALYDVRTMKELKTMF